MGYRKRRWRRSKPKEIAPKTLSLAKLKSRVKRNQNLMNRIERCIEDLKSEQHNEASAKQQMAPRFHAIHDEINSMQAAIKADAKSYRPSLRRWLRGGSIRAGDQLTSDAKQRIDQLRAERSAKVSELQDELAQITTAHTDGLSEATKILRTTELSRNTAMERLRTKRDEVHKKLARDKPVLNQRLAEENAVATKHAREVRHLKAYKAALEGRSRKEADAIRSQLKRSLQCPYCGGELGDNCHADHIYPVSKGGLSTIDNLVYVCRLCNQRKSDLTLAQFIKAEELDRDAIEQRLTALRKAY